MADSIAFSPEAEHDLHEIEVFENEVTCKGTQIAEAIVDRLNVVKGSIRLGIEVRSVEGLETRKLVIGSYGCFYQIESETELLVISIFDTRQNPEKLKV